MTIIHPPTLYLPPIGKIASFSAPQLLDALTYLQSLYNPQVRGSRLKHKHKRALNNENQKKPHFRHQDQDDSVQVQVIRSDPFERSHAIRWLIALIARLQVWRESSHSEEEEEVEEVEEGDLGRQELVFLTHTELLVQKASSLLAICAGVSAAGTMSRNFSFASMDGRRRIEAHLTDIPLDNDNYGSMGAQTWGGACVLADMIVEDPDRFGLELELNLNSDSPSKSRTLNILELGAGTGLVSIVVTKLVDILPSFKNRKVSVTATDFYPSVLANLRSNIHANIPLANDQSPSTSVHSITTHFLDWSSFSTATGPRPDSLSFAFDVIFGADVVYEAQHAVWIKDCLKTLLRRPCSSRDAISSSSSSSSLYPAVFHLVIPLRPTHAFETSMVESTFLKLKGCGCDDVDVDINGDIVAIGADLVILSKEFITCDAYGDCESDVPGRDRGEDVEYAYYKIGWSDA